MPRGLQVAFAKVVQDMAEKKGRELLPTEITDLFRVTYSLTQNPRFSIVDYSISPDRSTSPAPPEPGKTQDTRNLRRLFEGVVSIDGNEFQLRGRGNGPISSLANALRTIGIDLDVHDYKEHAVGRGRDVKAATFIECTAAGTEQRVWGVGIHEDVVQSSLIALLSAASNFTPSRQASPITKATTDGADGSAQVPDIINTLEAKADGM